MKIYNLRLNGNTYRYSYYKNSNTNQTVIYLSGALQDIESVQKFSESFANELNCIALELPGTGKTEVIQSTFSITDQATMLLDFINEFNLKDVHLIAFSYSTAVAVELCKIWPNVRSLSICCGVPGIPKSGRRSTQEILGIAMQSDRDPSAFAKKFCRSLTVSNDAIPRSSSIIRATEREISKMSPERIDAFIENTIRLYTHRSSSVSDISIPVLVLVGECDPYVIPSEARAFASEFKNAHFIALENADHMIHLQQTDKVIDIMITLASSSVHIERKLSLIK